MDDIDTNYIQLTTELDGTGRLWVYHPTETVQAISLNRTQLRRLIEQVMAIQC